MNILVIHNCFDDDWVNIYKRIVNASEMNCQYKIYINPDVNDFSSSTNILLYHFNLISDASVKEFENIVNSVKHDYLISTFPRPQHDDIARLLEYIQSMSHFIYYRPFDPDDFLITLNGLCKQESL